VKRRRRPLLPTWVGGLASQSENPFIRQAEEGIALLVDLDRSLPSEHSFALTTGSDMERLIDELRLKQGRDPTPMEINQVYWLDFADTIEAYSTLTVWRGAEILHGALRTLYERSILSSAVLARALLELACAFLVNANRIDPTVDEVVEHSYDRVLLSDIEEHLDRILYGTRIPALESHPKSESIGRYVRMISENPRAAELSDVYNHLSDVAHPNLMGNQRFWADMELVGGHNMVVMRRNAEAPASQEILGKTCGPCAGAPARSKGHLP
jgi:hypothetical protein